MAEWKDLGEVSRGKHDISFRRLCYLPASYLVITVVLPRLLLFSPAKNSGFRLPKIIFGGINMIEETDTSDRGKAKDRGKALRQGLHVYSLQFTLRTIEFLHSYILHLTLRSSTCS